MTKPIRHCEECGKSNEDGRIIDVYNDEGDSPGNLYCDPCVLGEARRVDSRRGVVMPARPEGYYHAAPGTFD